jgi:hypothetical protein
MASILGTKAQINKAKIAAAQEAAAKAPAARPEATPEYAAAKSRMLSLTVSPKDQSQITAHDIHLHHMLDVVSVGLNRLEDNKDVSTSTIARGNKALHDAVLHLSSHSAANRQKDFTKAAAHLDAAATSLGSVAGTVASHLGDKVTHVDGQVHSMGFIKSYSKDLSKHYSTHVAKSSGISGKLIASPADSYVLHPNDADRDLRDETPGVKSVRIPRSTGAFMEEREAPLSPTTIPTTSGTRQEVFDRIRPTAFKGNK